MHKYLSSDPTSDSYFGSLGVTLLFTTTVNKRVTHSIKRQFEITFETLQLPFLVHVAVPKYSNRYPDY